MQLRLFFLLLNVATILLSLIIVTLHNYSLPANDKLLVVYRQVSDVYQTADDQFPFYN